MTMAYLTGREEMQPCDSCGVDVIHREIKNIPGGLTMDPEPHEARCGLPCSRGGVSPAVYKSGAYHGAIEQCEDCCKRVHGKSVSELAAERQAKANDALAKKGKR